MHFAWRKSATKFLCVKTVSGKVAKHSLAQLTVQKWLVAATLGLLPEMFDQSDRVGAKSPIFDLFSLVASDSAVTTGEKSSINNNNRN